MRPQRSPGPGSPGAVLRARDAQASGEPSVKPSRHGDIRDVKHVMVLMQENRSFDHYYGSLRGVRGFGDRSTITPPGGLSVFQQPTTPPGTPVETTQYPWHLNEAALSAYPAGHQPPSSEVGAQGHGGTSHSWDDQPGAWFGGAMVGLGDGDRRSSGGLGRCAADVQRVRPICRAIRGGAARARSPARADHGDW